MRKNRMMRLASVLLVCVLLTTSVISGTFAKYISTASGSDTARVANWGWDNTATISIENLFLKAYDSGKVNSDTDIIAPGTQNNATFKFVYDEAQGSAPEVAYTLEVSTDGSTIDPTIESNAAIIWSLDGTEYPATATETSWDRLIKAIEGLDGADDGAEQYSPQEMPAAFSTSDTEHTVGWKWGFYVDGGQDVVDTNMGNADALANVKLVIKITATQVD